MAIRCTWSPSKVCNFLLKIIVWKHERFDFWNISIFVNEIYDFRVLFLFLSNFFRFQQGWSIKHLLPSGRFWLSKLGILFIFKIFQVKFYLISVKFDVPLYKYIVYVFGKWHDIVSFFLHQVSYVIKFTLFGLIRFKFLFQYDTIYCILIVGVIDNLFKSILLITLLLFQFIFGKKVWWIHHIFFEKTFSWLFFIFLLEVFIIFVHKFKVFIINNCSLSDIVYPLFPNEFTFWEILFSAFTANEICFLRNVILTFFAMMYVTACYFFMIFQSFMIPLYQVYQSFPHHHVFLNPVFIPTRVFSKYMIYFPVFQIIFCIILF